MSWWQWGLVVYAAVAIVLGAGTTFGVAGLSVTGPPPVTSQRPSIEITAFEWVFVGPQGVFYINWTALNTQPSYTATVHIAGVANPTTTSTGTTQCPPGGATPCTAHIAYTFPGTGTYTVWANVTANDLTGRVQISAQTIQHVLTISATSGSGGGGGVSLVAKFGYTQTPGTTSVQFTDNSIVKGATINTAAIQWNFGDGTTGMGATVSHAYVSSGRFSVVEQVSASTTNGGVVTNSTVHSVRVVPAACTSGTCSPNLNPGFSFTITGLTVTFTDTSTVAAGATIQSRTWNFGDGNTASGSPVTHTYSAAGSYRVNETLVANFSTAVSTKSITESVTVSTISTSGTGCTDLNCNGGSPAPFFNLNWWDGALLFSGIFVLLSFAFRFRENPVIVAGLGAIGGGVGFVLGTLF